MEVKAKLENLTEDKMDANSSDGAKEKPAQADPKPFTAVKLQDDSKRRIPLTSLSSAPSGSSGFTSGSAPRRVGLTTLTSGNSAADAAKPEAKNVSSGLDAKKESEPRRIQLQTLTSNCNSDEKSADNKPRRVQLTTLVTKPKEDDAMET